MLPLAAQADPILVASFSQGTLGDFGSITSTVVCSDTTNASSLSLGCSGSQILTPPSSFGSFAGTSQAVVNTVDGIGLGISSTIDVVRQNALYSGSGDRYFAGATTSAGLTDTVTALDAGTGEGFLQLMFTLTGTFTELADEFSGDGFNPNLPGDHFFAHSQATLGVNGVFATVFGGSNITLNVPITLGVDQLLTTTFGTIVSADILVSEGYRVTADFLNTATLSTALILDSSMNPIGGASLVSAGGYTYGDLTNPPPSAVPEPSTLALLLIGAGTAAVRRRRDGRT
jgi:hypothetical protein